MTNSHDSVDAANLVQDSTFQNETAQIQAKALLTEVSEGPLSIDWRYVANRVVRQAVWATFGLENLARSSPGQVEPLSAVARKLALVWEALAELREGTSRETALVNSAVNYEIAGYQANAAFLAKHLGIPWSRSLPEQPNLIQLVSLFLQRSFLQFLDASLQATQEPRSGQRATPATIQALGTALAARGLRAAASHFLAGESTLSRTSDDLSAAENVFAAARLVEEANVVRSIRSLLPIMSSRSTWTLLRDCAPESSKWQRYLKLLARGVGQDIYKGRSIVELWPSQIAAINQGLLDGSSSKLVRMPTSAGKTRIAELAIVHTLVTNPGAKCVYLAPFRALAKELEQSFLGLISDLGFRVSSVTGTYESDDFEEQLFRQTDLLVITPERLDLLLRTLPEALSDVRLFVIDEAQVIQDPHRGVKFELLITRLRRRFPSSRFLLMSAVIPQQTLVDFAEWFNLRLDSSLLTSIWRPSIQRVGKFEWSGLTGVVRYAPTEDEGILQEFVPGVIRQRVHEYVHPATRRRRIRKFPGLTDRSEIAADLAFKFAELGPVLVFCPQPRLVRSVAKALQERIELALFAERNVPQHFGTHPESRSVVLSDEWLGDRPITSWLKLGIGVHFGDLPDVVRTAIEEDFRLKKLRVLVATTTLAQGVNLPVRTIVIHSSRRFDEATETLYPIPAREYWNVAGRAGRAGEETEGLVIHIRLNDDDERDFRYYLAHRQEVEPIEGALYQRLVGLINQRLSLETLRAEIDPEILAILAEEDPARDPVEIVDEIIGSSLVRVQSERARQDNTLLRSSFVDVARSIAGEVPDAELRRVYSSTGLSSQSCQALRAHALGNEPTAGDLLRSAGLQDLDRIIDFLMPAVAALPEMQPRHGFGGDFPELIRRWIRGASIKAIMDEFAESDVSTEELGQFIDETVRYLLPWGTSGYLRVAASVLSIEKTELSTFARFLPSMVKYGVPDPIACWAVSVGVTIRTVAMRLAADYRGITASPEYDGFLEWLGTLDSETLHRGYGLQAPLLDDITRAISTYGGNPTLRGLASIETFLPRDVMVRGVEYENRATVALMLRAGQDLELVRDYDNLVDRNAVAVNFHGQQLGYVARDVAQILAPEMDVGLKLRAVAVRVERAETPRIRMRIERAE